MYISDENLENIYWKTKPLRSGIFIVFDTETNGLADCSVMSVSALKCITESNGDITEIDRFDRYYYSKEPPNSYALKVNGLTEKRLAKLREGQDYPRYFSKDLASFYEFCRDTTNYVGFNVNFDIGFVERALPTEIKAFDLFAINKNIIIESNTKTDTFYRYNLEGTAEFYGIDPNQGTLHTSMWDTIVTAMILQKMLRLGKVAQ